MSVKTTVESRIAVRLLARTAARKNLPLTETGKYENEQVWGEVAGAHVRSEMRWPLTALRWIPPRAWPSAGCCLAKPMPPVSAAEVQRDGGDAGLVHRPQPGATGRLPAWAQASPRCSSLGPSCSSTSQGRYWEHSPVNFLYPNLRLFYRDPS